VLEWLTNTSYAVWSGNPGLAVRADAHAFGERDGRRSHLHYLPAHARAIPDDSLHLAE